ncbi:MAG: hypothetical protein ABIB47_03290 [Candidatus Woesearchaeota archaeon]
MRRNDENYVLRKKEPNHIEMRNKVESFLKKGFSMERIAERLSVPIGTKWIKGSVRWYRSCLVAKENQKKAIEKHPDLYSRAGKIAQKKHPWLGKELGKKYGPIQGKINARRLRGNSKYFSKMARRLQEISPEHSRINMKKAHKTMEKNGTFYKHQREAALKCIEKNPNHLDEMTKKALESRRKNYPYEFMGCLFDSNEERETCKLFVKNKLITKPVEGKNIHTKVSTCYVDFFIKRKLFVEFHPIWSIKGHKEETAEDYYKARRKLLDENGYRDHPLVVINNFKDVDSKINEIRALLSFKLEK